ncbi:PREDICTED: uncharacterized protein LOC107346806 isoform X3 [Acropora digitifera]|uniref:uncharacterized protein LOC107346806 isoform X3 n=1 Tax=Acropora digitifera TaxID=70779 RepID=UPI00077AE59C|nr:PREDICTED: uncharacterized protein LOC107346806 isoform X3 [Acropora digitifera]
MTAIPVFLTRGGTTFAGLSVFPPVPKKYIGFLSLGFGAGCGWFVSHRAVISCHRSLSIDATVNNKDSQSKVKFQDSRNTQHPKTTAGNKVWRQRISQGVILIVVKMAMRYFCILCSCG